MGLIAYAPPRMVAPPHLRAKILAVAQASASPSRLVNWTAIPWRKMAAAAVALLVL